MNLIDEFSIKLLRSLANMKGYTFKELVTVIKNKRTLLSRLTFFQERNMIIKDKVFYNLTEKGGTVLSHLKEIEKLLTEENAWENLEAVPSYFQNYLSNFLSELRKKFRVTLLSVILFGSIARGKWTKSSDLDLFIIFSDDHPDKRKLNETLVNLIIDFHEWKVRNKLKDDTSVHSIQATVMRLKDLNAFRTLFYDIAMDGIIIFDKDQTGQKFIERIGRRMKEKHLIRIYVGDRDFFWKHEKFKFGELREL